MTSVPAPFRVRSLVARLARRARATLPGQRTTYVAERVEEYRRYWSDAAAALGARFEDILPGVWAVERGGHRTVLANYVTQCDDPIVLQLAGDKAHCYRLAIGAGVAVPEHREFTLARFRDAVQLLERVGGPLVVKPAAGTSSGLGVSTSIRTKRQLVSAATLASLYDQRMLVERMMAGESYRILYLEGCPIHAVRRRGVRVRGDGRTTIADLLRAGGLTSLVTDSLVTETLAAQRLAIAHVPPAGADVLVRGLPMKWREQELRTVYDESVLDQCCPALLRECGAVVRALGSELAGVDVITTNPGLPLSQANGAFIEINTTPGIHHHYVGQANGGSAPVAETVLDYLLTRKAGC